MIGLNNLLSKLFITGSSLRVIQVIKLRINCNYGDYSKFRRFRNLANVKDVM